MLTFFNFLIHADSIEYTNNYCNRCNPDVMNSQRPIEHFEIKTIMAMGFKMCTLSCKANANGKSCVLFTSYGKWISVAKRQANLTARRAGEKE